MNDVKKTLYVIVIVIFSLGLFGAYYYGTSVGYLNGYEKARVEIRKLLEEQRIVEPVPKDVRIISGTILSLGNSQFVLESRVPFDPTLPVEGQNKAITKTVLVTPSTNIFVRTINGGQLKSLNAGLKSLKPSEQVVVEASENIADKSSFEASAVYKNEE